VDCGAVVALLAKVQPTGVKPGPGGGPLQAGSVQRGPVRVSDCGEATDDSRVTAMVTDRKSCRPLAAPVSVAEAEALLGGFDPESGEDFGVTPRVTEA
jgi:hypothetical protein